MRLVDLFAGTGAFSLAFEQTGNTEIVFANDQCESSKEIYDANFDHQLTLGDLNELPISDIPKHDILTGGFPCQPFSVAGEQAGFNDPRSNVFWKILEIIDHHQTRCVILENVKNILTHDNHRTFQTICSEFEKRSYQMVWKILDTAKITGIPQHRERMYLVAIKDKVIPSDLLDFADVPKKPLVDFLDPSVTRRKNGKYYYSDSCKVWPLIEEHVTEADTFYQYRRTLVRKNKSGVCPTLTANMGSGGHNVPLLKVKDGIRKLTPRECFNFQGFPDTYHLPDLADSKLYKLAGNAVSLPIVVVIAQRVINLLND